jgi:hypothetical protein
MVKVRFQRRPRGYFWNAVVEVSLGGFVTEKAYSLSNGVHTVEECAQLGWLQ